MADKQYIERECALQVIEKYMTDTAAKAKTMVKDVYLMAKDHAKDFLSIIPAADVVEVRRGEWIFLCAVSTMQYKAYEYRCSLCNEVEEMYKKKPFCPNCGADMRGDKR